MSRRVDIGGTFDARRYGALSWVLHGTLAAQDYLGDTANSDGVPMPVCEVTGADYHLGSADDGNTEVTVHNVTQGTSASFTLSTNGVDEEEGISLAFEAGDELAVEVTNVNTPGSDMSLGLRLDKDRVPPNA